MENTSLFRILLNRGRRLYSILWKPRARNLKTARLHRVHSREHFACTWLGSHTLSHRVKWWRISDFTELIEILFPGNRNQQHAAACIFFELKWANSLVPNLAYLESKYDISRRVLQRARAKLSRVGLIEHVSYLNSRYGGQHGWKLSSRFEGASRLLAERCARFKDRTTTSKEKDLMLVELMDARRRNKGSLV